MKDKILIGTADLGYGELIQQTINEQTPFNAVLVMTGQDVLPVVKQDNIKLCVIDADLVGQFTSILVDRIRQYLPSIKIIVIHHDDNPDSAWVSDVRVDDYLKNPSMPDLLNTIERFLQRRPVQMIKSSPSTLLTKNLVWLQDPANAAQYLTSLYLSSAAHAALIVREGSLWAYAGQLSLPAIQELTHVVSNDCQQKTSIDSSQVSTKITNLTRFVHLGADGGEYILYTTQLSLLMVLALVFDVGTPFSTVRAQAFKLANSLSQPPSAVKSELELQDNIQPAQQGKSKPENSTDSDLPSDMVAPLWDDIPPSGLDHTSSPLELPATDVDYPDEPISGKPLLDHETPDITSPDLQGETRVVPANSYHSFLSAEGNSVWDLTYLCIFIPRFPRHYLAGDLAQYLTEWIDQLCIAFGWRLVNLFLLPDYLQLIVNVPPTVSPSYIIQNFRQHTSRRIFSTFGILADENPSGDFWAPGYLITSVKVQSGAPKEDTHYLPEGMIKEFIQKTRKSQGISGLTKFNYSR